MPKTKKNIFDLSLFKRLLIFIKPYRWVFYGTLLAVVGLAVFGALRPLVLQQAIDNNIAKQSADGFLVYIIAMLVLLILEVSTQLLFIYYALHSSFTKIM